MLLFASLLVAIAIANCAPLNENNPMEGPYFGGDMLGVFDSRGVANLETYRYKRWTNGTIPYVLDGVYSFNQRTTILSGMRQIESQVGSDCIKFVPRTNEATYITIHGSLQGCYSYVGMQQRSGSQVVSLSTNGCIRKGIVMHELLHAVGFHHEQNRPDRDNYLTIYFQNIKPDMAYNFDLMTTTVDTQGFPYDYASIMHYQGTAFSKNGRPTMVPKQPGAVIAGAETKNRMTAIDVAEVKKWYSCKA